LTGIQSASEPLKKLSAKVSNPIAWPSLIASEGPKRIKRMLGKADASLGVSVPSSLAPAVDLLEKRTAAFAAAVESLMMKYKKDVVNQQLPLKRIANAAMELYAMVSTISRAAKSLEKKLPTAEQEVLITNTFAREAAQRILENLQAVTGPNTDKNIKLIAQAAYKDGGYSPIHPLGF
jgi:hypothetical protein